MRIGICDDELESRMQIRKLIKAQSCMEEIQIEEFSTLEQLKQCSHRLDVLFLDIEIGSDNSLDYVEKHQFSLEISMIILISSHSCYITKSYQFSIFQFLLKPIQTEIFAYVFTECLNQYYRLKQFCKLTDKAGQSYQIPLNRIVSIQSEHRQIMYYACTGNKYWGTKQSLTTVLKQLRQFGICQVAKGYLINLSFVTAIEGAEAIIKVNNKSYSIEIGEKYVEEVKRQYLHYLALQGEK